MLKSHNMTQADYDAITGVIDPLVDFSERLASAGITSIIVHNHGVGGSAPFDFYTYEFATPTCQLVVKVRSGKTGYFLTDLPSPARDTEFYNWDSAPLGSTVWALSSPGVAPMIVQEFANYQTLSV